MVFFFLINFFIQLFVSTCCGGTITLTSGFTVIGESDNVSMCSIILKIGKIIILFNGVKETKNK